MLMSFGFVAKALLRQTFKTSLSSSETDCQSTQNRNRLLWYIVSIFLPLPMWNKTQETVKEVRGNAIWDAIKWIFNNWGALTAISGSLLIIVWQWFYQIPVSLQALVVLLIFWTALAIGGGIIYNFWKNRAKTDESKDLSILPTESESEIKLQREVESLKAEIALLKNPELGEIEFKVTDSQTMLGFSGAECIAKNNQINQLYCGHRDKRGRLRLFVPHGFYTTTISAENYETRTQATNVNENEGQVEVYLQRMPEKTS